MTAVNMVPQEQIENTVSLIREFAVEDNSNTSKDMDQMIAVTHEEIDNAEPSNRELAFEDL